MAKPLIVEDADLELMLAVTAESSRMPARDTALLLTLYGNALGITELASIQISDYLEADGATRTESAVRSTVSFNQDERPLYWTNPRVVAGLDAYLTWRQSNQHGIGPKQKEYRGLDPSSPIFLTDLGRPYALTKRELPTGKLSFSCNSLGAHIVKLHSNAGIQGGSAQSARRTFAVKQYRLGRSLAQIAAILGHKSVDTTKRLINSDIGYEQVRLSDIVAKSI